MKQINVWLREKRLQKRMTLDELAEKAKYSKPSISRIENGLSTAPLLAIVRLMVAMGYSWLTLFEEGFVGNGTPLPLFFLEGKPEDYNFPCFIWSDFDLFDQMQLNKKGVDYPIVANLIKQFLTRFNPDIPSYNINAYVGNFYMNLDLAAVSNVYLSEDKLPYPRNFSIDTLRKIVLSGGVLIFRDVGAFLYSLRQERGLSLRKLAHSSNMSHPALMTIEQNTPDRVSLNNLIALDNALELKGELVFLAWKAAEFYLGLYRVSSPAKGEINPWSEGEIRFLEKLIFVSRLFQQYYPEDRSWLDWYREQALEKFHTVLRS
ncbi:MAG: helix-turn-helix transcriptional regulator [Candidatus Bathyarchaeia archaeon]